MVSLARDSFAGPRETARNAQESHATGEHDVSSAINDRRAQELRIGDDALAPLHPHRRNLCTLSRTVSLR
jgi:hypothetical protein